MSDFGSNPRQRVFITNCSGSDAERERESPSNTGAAKPPPAHLYGAGRTGTRVGVLGSHIGFSVPDEQTLS